MVILSEKCIKPWRNIAAGLSIAILVPAIPSLKTPSSQLARIFYLRLIKVVLNRYI